MYIMEWVWQDLSIVHSNLVILKCKLCEWVWENFYNLETFFWLIVITNFKKYITPLLTLAKEALSIPLVMSMSEAFSVPFLTLIKLCYTKALKWSSLVPGPEAKSSSEITNPTQFTLSYHFQSPTARLELTTTGAVLPSGQDSPLVLYLCNPTLYEWKWTERKAFARLTVVASNLNQHYHWI